MVLKTAIEYDFSFDIIGHNTLKVGTNKQKQKQYDMHIKYKIQKRSFN